MRDQWWFRKWVERMKQRDKKRGTALFTGVPMIFALLGSLSAYGMMNGGDAKEEMTKVVWA